MLPSSSGSGQVSLGWGWGVRGGEALAGDPEVGAGHLH